MPAIFVSPSARATVENVVELGILDMKLVRIDTQNRSWADIQMSWKDDREINDRPYPSCSSAIFLPYCPPRSTS